MASNAKTCHRRWLATSSSTDLSPVAILLGDLGHGNIDVHQEGDIVAESRGDGPHSHPAAPPPARALGKGSKNKGVLNQHRSDELGSAEKKKPTQGPQKALKMTKTKATQAEMKLKATHRALKAM